MRTVLGLVIAAVTSTGALSADFGYEVAPADDIVYGDEVVRFAPPRTVVVRRSACIRCRGSWLPYGGLRPVYRVQLPFGGLDRYCPPNVTTREVVLIRKG